jgi:hypothetical protein
MPDIRILHQDSENSGKGEHIEGHIFAQTSAVISNGDVSRSLPLMVEKQLPPLKNPETKMPMGETLATQMANLIIKSMEALGYETKAVAVLDAYFSKASGL